MHVSKHTRKNFLRLGLAAAATAGLPRFAGAQDAYPDKPVRVVVSYGAGGAIDVVARILAEHMTGTFGKTVLVRSSGLDRYRRTLGRVEVDGVDVNLRMVRDGFAWHYVAYSKDAALATAQAEAKAGKRGLWIDAGPVPPWGFRRGR